MVVGAWLGCEDVVCRVVGAGRGCEDDVCRCVVLVGDGVAGGVCVVLAVVRARAVVVLGAVVTATVEARAVAATDVVATTVEGVDDVEHPASTSNAPAAMAIRTFTASPRLIKSSIPGM